jgi:hypothetical protein
MMAPMVGFAELLTIVMMMGGVGGLPVGVPPGPEDPLLAKIAPAECLYYTTWAGMAEPDAASGNHTEQLLAEPEVRAALTEAEATIRRLLLEAAAREGDPRATLAADAAPKLIRTLLTRPTAIYLTSVTPRADGADVRGGAVVNCGDKADETRELLERLQRAALSELPPDAAGVVEEVTIGDSKFHRIRPPAPDAPLITWGVRGEYLIVGIGEGEVEGILDRAKTDPPAWLVEARKSVSVPRTSSFAHANLKAIRELVLPLAPDPAVRTYVAAAGLMNVDSYTAVTGLDDSGFVTRSLLSIEGEAKGVFALADAKPLTAADLKIVPQGSAAAVAVRLDPETVHETVMSVIREADPRAGDGVDAAIIGAGTALGLDLREDVFKSLGDTWYVYSDPGAGGFITGWTAAVKVRNRMQLEEVHSKLLRVFEASLPPGGRASIKRTAFAGHDIYYLSVRDDDMLVAPAWCITDDYLVAGLYPQTIKAFLSRGQDFKSLADSPEVAQAFEAEGKPLMVSYVDAAQFFEPLYSLLQEFAQAGFAEAQRNGVDLDITLLPSAGSIKKHLRPSVGVVKRTEAGIEVVARQTIPGGNVGTTAPVLAALLLPAVQASREAARRATSRNNLRQIGLGVLNFADANAALPAAYSVDEEGKPLLSWRVHILPYIEERALYERFKLDEPWDSEHNRALIPLMPQVYRSPNSSLEPGKSNYLAVRVEKAMLTPPRDGDKGREMPRGIGFESITDGTSNTILAVEVTDEKAVEWTRPDDFVPSMRNPLEGLTGLRPGGFNALFGDSHVQFISESIDHESLRNLFTRDDGKVVEIP